MSAPAAGSAGRRARSAGCGLLVVVAVLAGGCGGGDGASSSVTSTSTVAREGRWEEIGALGEGRGGHTATLLANGTVLVVGGGSADPEDVGLKTAELFDPAAGRWRPTLSLATPRAGHAATLLRDGTVLVTGGLTQATAELYDPGAGTWSAAPDMGTPRNGHTATLLNDGRVLVVGGFPARDVPPAATAEVYDPVARRWSPAGQLSGGRGYHAATVLADGRVLVSAGNAANLSRQVNATTTSTTAGFTTQPGGDGGGGEVATAEIYDPATNRWSPTGELGAPRSAHTATLLADGRVLVAGGFSPAGVLDSTELYDVAAGSWSAAEDMPNSRTIHTATLLANGSVLVVGGRAGSDGSVLSSILPSGNLYDPGTGSWRPTAELTTRRVAHTATLLPDGRVLVAGGLNESGTLSASEVFTLTA